MTLSKKGGWGQENGKIWKCSGKNDIFLGGEGSKTNVIFLHVDKFLLIPDFNTVYYYTGKWESYGYKLGQI